MTVNKVLVDTNILVRLIVKDPMVAQLTPLLVKVKEGNVVLVVEPLIFAELVFVLQSLRDPETQQRAYTKETIATKLESLLDVKGFEFGEKEVLRSALRLYHSRNVDFADAYLSAKSTDSQCVLSFDHDISRLTSNARHPNEY